MVPELPRISYTTSTIWTGLNNLSGLNNLLFVLKKACSSGCGWCFRVLFHYYGNYLFQNVFHCTPSCKPNPKVAQNSQVESAARKRKSTISMFYIYLVFLVCNLPLYCVRVAYLIESPPSTAFLVSALFSKTLMFLLIPL